MRTRAVEVTVGLLIDLVQVHRRHEPRQLNSPMDSMNSGLAGEIWSVSLCKTPIYILPCYGENFALRKLKIVHAWKHSFNRHQKKLKGITQSITFVRGYRTAFYQNTWLEWHWKRQLREYSLFPYLIREGSFWISHRNLRGNKRKFADEFWWELIKR